MAIGLAVSSTWFPYFLGFLGVLFMFAAVWLIRMSRRYLGGALALVGALLMIVDLVIRHVNLGK
ncbi:MAG: hypothetical protein WA254_04625 [Candidatus Sulfotelmatobacter sp.]